MLETPDLLGPAFIQAHAYDEKLKKMATVKDIFLGWDGTLHTVLTMLFCLPMYRFLSFFRIVPSQEQIEDTLQEYCMVWFGVKKGRYTVKKPETPNAIYVDVPDGKALCD